MKLLKENNKVQYGGKHKTKNAKFYISEFQQVIEIIRKNPLQIIIKDSKKINEYTHIDNIFS